MIRYDVYRRLDGDTGWARYRSITEGPKMPNPKEAAMIAAYSLMTTACEVKVEKVEREIVYRDRTRRAGELL